MADSTWMTGTVDTSGVAPGAGADLRNKAANVPWPSSPASENPALAEDGVEHQPLDASKFGHISPDTTGTDVPLSPGTAAVADSAAIHTPLETAAVYRPVSDSAPAPAAEEEPVVEDEAPVEEAPEETPEPEAAPEPEPEVVETPVVEDNPPAIEDAPEGEPVDPEIAAEG